MSTRDEFYYRAYEEHLKAIYPGISGEEILKLLKRAEYWFGQPARSTYFPYLFKSDNIEIDLLYENSIAINILAKHITSENFDNVFKTIKQYIYYGANSNIPDEQNMTPIYYIFENEELDDEKKKIIIEYLVNLEYPKVDIDACIYRTNNVRTLLISKFPDMQLPLDATNESHFLILPKLLREKQENDFLQYFLDDRFVIKIPDAIYQRNNFILCLLKRAIRNGLNKALKILLDRRFFNVGKDSLYSGITTACNIGNSLALEMLLERYNFSLKDGRSLVQKIIQMLDKTNGNNDYIGCLDLLIDSSKINGLSLSYALDYAIHSKKDELITKLYKKGASLLPVSLEYINPEVLEKCFDTCITTNGVKHGESNFGIRINYKNFRTYHYGEETMTIEGIAESKNLKHLLSHPLISSFLFLKWHQLSAFFYMNLIVCFCFYIWIISYIFLDLNKGSEAFKIAFIVLSSLGLTYLILREIIQCFTPWRIMFTTSFVLFSNCIEIALIVVTILTLSNSNYQNEPQRSFAVLTILLVSVETYLLLGSLPILSFSTHMLMLNAVCVSFIKSLFQYAIFFVTFGLCFHITFSNTKIKTNNDTDTDTGYFNNVFGSTFKTFIMVTGEFESGSINFNSPTSYAIFILFVAFMSIIMLNLLNGLAVSDIQMIRKQAELNSTICRTYIIANLETSLRVFGNIRFRLFDSIFNNRTASVRHYIHGDYINIELFNGNKIVTKKKQRQFDFSTSNYFSRWRQSFFQLENSAMDPSIVQAALNVLEKKQRIQEQEKSVLEQKDLLKNIKQKAEEQEIRLRNIQNNVEMILPLLQKLTKNVK